MFFPIPTITSTVCSMCSAFYNGISSLGSTVSTFASSVFPKIGAWIGDSLESLKGFANLISNILQIFGIFNENEDVGKIGAQIVYAQEMGINIDDYESVEEFLTKARTLEVDETVISHYNSADRIMAGIAVGSAALDEKLKMPEGSTASLLTLNIIDKEFFSTENLQSLLNHSNNVGAIIDYFSGKGSPTYIELAEKILIDIESKSNPESSDSKNYERLDAIKDKVIDRLNG